MSVVILHGALPSLPKVAPFCCSTLSPLLLEHCVMLSVANEWGNEKKTYAARENKNNNQHVLWLIEKGAGGWTINNQHTCVAWLPGPARRTTKQSIYRHGAETKEQPLQNKNNFPSASMMQQKENRHGNRIVFTLGLESHTWYYGTPVHRWLIHAAYLVAHGTTSTR